MSTNVVLLSRKPFFIVASVLAIGLAMWGCKDGSDRGGGNDGASDTTSHNDGGSGAGSNTGGGGSCADPSAPEPPEKSCDPAKDVSTQCPLPETVSIGDGSYTTVYYYSDPACVLGKCRYCSTSTTTEDPNATGAP